jgi:predicted membrane protein
METGNNKMDRHPDNSNRFIIGIILIIAGAILILQKTTMLPPALDHFIGHVIFSWQMLLVAIGLVVLVGSENKTPGIVLISVGGFFMIPELFSEYFENFNFFWPAIFIVIGVVMLVNSRRSKERILTYSGEKNADMIDYVHIFSGAERQLITDNFMGGKITSIFGGGEVDLTRSHLAPGSNILEITCIFGGATILVPEDWNVKLELTPILGGFSDSRKLRSDIQKDPSRELIIRGVVIFGGGEVKCFK